MEIEIRQAALGVIWREKCFLVAEIQDPATGILLHRPPGGGVEDDETPEAAVRRELQEELGMEFTIVRRLGHIDHTWYWNGREVRERAWLFVVDCPHESRMRRGEAPDLFEGADRRRTLWRSIDADGGQLPALCPASLLEALDVLR